MTSPRARPLSTPPEYAALMLKTPSEAGYRMPAEWERHACCWMSWPSRPDQWVDGLAGAQSTYAAVACAIRRFEPVNMVAEPDCAAEARAPMKRPLRSKSPVARTSPINGGPMCPLHGMNRVK
jgi:hypothetical protein